MLMISIPISATPRKLPQYYGFTTGRHSGSMFLKIGAAVFCVIHIIHIFLIIVKEVNSSLIDSKIQKSLFLLAKWFFKFYTNTFYSQGNNPSVEWLLWKSGNHNKEFLSSHFCRLAALHDIEILQCYCQQVKRYIIKFNMLP